MAEKPRLFLIHWNAAEARALAAPLRHAGWTVSLESEDGARASRRILASPPRAVVIYLTRLPSHGRETAHAVRASKAGRTIPMIFVGGEGPALEKVRAKVPDAVYTTPQGLPAVLAGLSRG